MKFLFGGGWWTAWYVLYWAGAVMFVILPVVMIVRDAVPKPAGPASLASVVLTMGIAGFLGLVTLIDATAAARLAGQGWWISLLIGAVACATATVIPYMVMVKLCTDGGYAWSWTAGLVCGTCLIANLAALSYGRSVEHKTSPQAAGPALTAPH